MLIWYRNRKPDRLCPEIWGYLYSPLTYHYEAVDARGGVLAGHHGKLTPGDWAQLADVYERWDTNPFRPTMEIFFLDAEEEG